MSSCKLRLPSSRDLDHTFPFPMPSELPGYRVGMVKVKEVPIPGTDYCKVVTEDDSKVAILFSPRHSTGWSTQLLRSYPEHIIKKLLYHSFIIRYIFAQGKDSMTHEKLMTKYIGFSENDLPYCGSLGYLAIAFVPQ